MFERKKTIVLRTKESKKEDTSVLRTKESKNKFLNYHERESTKTRSGNGALKLTTTGSPFVDQFGKASEYLKPRSYADVAKDMEKLWKLSPLFTVKFSLYLRTIVRKTAYDNKITDDSQKGAELKSEAIMRFIWIAVNHPHVFMNNIQLFIAVGSWKDIFEMMTLDLEYHGWEHRKLPWSFLYKVIRSGIDSESQVGLVKKYLPTIRSSKKASTNRAKARNLIGLWLAHNLFIEQPEKKRAELYRRLKSSGEAHEWQQLISQEKFTLIDFDKIHGKALSKLVKSKFLKNHNLSEKYNDWIKKPERREKGVKVTGFVHEVLEPLLKYSNQHIAYDNNTKLTMIEQFNSLVNKAKNGRENKTSFIPVIDTSSSMNSPIVGQSRYTSEHVARSITLFLSSFLSGTFTDHYIEFATRTKIKRFESDSVIDRYSEFSRAYGSTNFLGAIDILCITRAHVPEEEFPTGMVCISDGEFNSGGYYNETNFDAARRKLRQAGFSEKFVKNFTFVLWDIRNTFYGNRSASFENRSDVPGAFYFGSYSPSVISFLVNSKIETAEELFLKAMDQEILNLVKI